MQIFMNMIIYACKTLFPLHNHQLRIFLLYENPTLKHSKLFKIYEPKLDKKVCDEYYLLLKHI